MAKYNVLKKFRDKETKEVYEVGAVIDMTVKRAEEVAVNLDDSFLERVEEKKDDKKAGKDDQKEDKKEK
ncbi:hypothetical protein D8N35_12775 [Enterococcus casseliflavus]|uniref:hypothetical protein n=1 Tax=Enterococcus casseliflavus TaxID=37734 RepID=UPI000EB45950|nr:hypothetical protein [Enterococcus casseliflavus]AYJ46884.1 hypothetical protein D8N35_12775 [Enterococcus casseliflavus]